LAWVEHNVGVPPGLDGHPDPISSSVRAAMLEELSALVRQESGPRTLVGIDGASGTGKSTLADECASTLSGHACDVVRASIDSFHRPKADRYRRGDASPEGYYRDSHDLEALRTMLLEPFASMSRTVRTEVFDQPSDRPSKANPVEVAPNAILVFDGLFLHRPELVDPWDLSVFLVAEGRREAVWRNYVDLDLPEDPDARAAERAGRVARARRERYTTGQRLYETEADPTSRATIVVDNDDLANPRIIRRNPDRP
jgi:uridine kinase